MRHDQPTLRPLLDLPFDAAPSTMGLQAGAADRDTGTSRAEVNASDEFTNAVWSALQRVCKDRQRVTSDDIWTHLDGQGVGHLVPKRANIIGAVMRGAGKKGWLRATDVTTKTCREAGHARRILVWESLLFVPKAVQ